MLVFFLVLVRPAHLITQTNKYNMALCFVILLQIKVGSSDHVGPTGVKKKDLIRKCVPPNIVEATMQQYRILKLIA